MPHICNDSAETKKKACHGSFNPKNSPDNPYHLSRSLHNSLNAVFRYTDEIMALTY